MTPKGDKSRLRIWGRRLAVLLVALLLTVVLLEVVLRSTGAFGVNHPSNTLRYRTEMLLPTWGPPEKRDLDGTLYRHRPNVEVDFGDFTIRTNSLGLRGPEVAVAKPEGTHRIVVLGDSVTLGWGVDDEHTFTRRLERKLNSLPGGPDYQVINTGHNGYDTVQEAALFEREAIHLAPDLVILVYVINDIEPTRNLVEAHLALEGQPATEAGEQPPGPTPTAGDWLELQGRRYLPATTTLVSTLLGLLSPRAGSKEGGNVAGVTDVPGGERGWERSKRALLSIRDLCRARQVPFLVLDHTLPRLPVLREFCEGEGIPVEDFHFTPEDFEQDITNSLVDPHANPLGNEILLHKLERALQTRGLLEF